jgi:protease-4
MKRPVRWLLVAVFVALLAVALLRGAGPDVEAGSVLVVDLEGEFIEAPEEPLVARLLGAGRQPLAALLSELGKAERDERLSAVHFRIRSLDLGWAKAQELRGAIERLRERGRRTVAWLEIEKFGPNLEYYVASAADEVWMAPGARNPLVGLAAEHLFLGGLFEKLGVQVEYERVGAYKSAVETFSETRMSEANREMATAILDSIDAQFVRGIAAGRRLDEAKVREAIDAAPTSGAEMQAHGLVDGVAFHDEILKKAGDPPVVEADDYAAVDASDVGFAPQATFALIYGSGPVVQGSGSSSRRGSPVLASRTVAKAIEDAAEDEGIRAIVLRVDSPGGSALASDEVWRATRRAREAGKPVVASFSDVAASGGYYVACGADKVVAEPGTLTGSIGVFVLRPVLAGAFEKLGIGVESMTRGEHADLLLSTRPLSPGTRERVRADVEGVYRLFVERVAEGRSLEPEGVDAVGRGRVFTGEQAHERGLVDVLGGLRTAVVEAKRAAGIAEDADVALVPYPPPRPLLEQLTEAVEVRVAASQAWLPLPRELRRVAETLSALPAGAALAIPPLLPEIR